MKTVREILTSAGGARKSIFNTWAKISAEYFEAVARVYPGLVEANIRSVCKATVDLIQKGDTDDSSIGQSQYRRLPLDQLRDPVFQALYEVGAIDLNRSGDPVVEPNPF